MIFFESILILFYAAVILFLIKWSSFFKNSGIKFKWLASVFILKIFAGWFYLWVHKLLYNGGDTHLFLSTSHTLSSFLKEDVNVFLQLTFGKCAIQLSEASNFYKEQLNFWTDPSSYFLVRTNALLNFLSFNFKSVNTVIWQLFSFTGLVAIFKSFHHFFKVEKNLLFAGIFLVPSVLFWHSGIHKESLSIFTIGICTWAAIKNIYLKRDWAILMIAIVSVYFMFIVRNYLVLLLLAALVPFVVSSFVKFPKFLVYISCYLILFVLAILTSKIFPELNFLEKINEIHYYFLTYSQGTSDLTSLKYEPTFVGFLKTLPQAFLRSISRPHFLDIKDSHLFFRAIVTVETWCILILIIFAFYKILKNKLELNNLTLFALIFSFTFFTLIGIAIDNLGALSRYKSVVYPLLIPTVLYFSDIKFIKNIFERIKL